MDDLGQMILLSALLACICLLGVVACVAAVNDSAYADGRHLSGDGMANIRWAQECALRRTAIFYTSATWDGRFHAVSGFKDAANSSSGNVSEELLKHGIFYRFTFNDSLAAEYAAAHPDNNMESIGGVLVERSGNTAKVSGCAYDISAEGRGVSYRLCRVITFD
ncbi:MAG TPA: hypothetical protein VMC84_08235 [Methanocella sp.]|uniref:DUF7261 family protein n=1 Tax=Methanocella sp. TaxID=2052833 RepID=UPI002CDA7DE3|nr:hypothetical protein [Methanocella sp.]HTY91147.1 hypothetical protein [Methanocella sp.]